MLENKVFMHGLPANFWVPLQELNLGPQIIPNLDCFSSTFSLDGL
jgi:hypothetical protein